MKNWCLFFCWKDFLLPHQSVAAPGWQWLQEKAPVWIHPFFVHACSSCPPRCLPFCLLGTVTRVLSAVRMRVLQTLSFNGTCYRILLLPYHLRGRVYRKIWWRKRSGFPGFLWPQVPRPHHNTQAGKQACDGLVETGFQQHQHTNNPTITF